MDCPWEEFIEFRNTKEAFIEDHIINCVMNPHNEININEESEGVGNE